MDMWKVPLRLFPGLFILNAGIGKLRTGSGEQATRVHDMARRTYPMFSSIPPVGFVRALGAGESALGAAMLTPFVPTAFAGAALTGFAGGLLWMYWKTPGLHAEGSVRPTPQGTAIAKDSWLLGIGLALMLGSVGRKPRGRRATKGSA